MYIGLHVKYPLFLSHFTELRFSRHIFEKPSSTKLKKKTIQWELSCSKRTDTTKLSVAFGNFSNAPKKVPLIIKISNQALSAGDPKIYFNHNIKNLMRLKF